MIADTELPLVSIIMPLFNSAHTVKQAVASVLAQEDYPNFELIIIDDASQDHSLKVVKSFDDPRIKLLQHETNQNAASARNTGIREAKGEYISFIDADDLWEPNKLSVQIHAMVESGFLVSTTEYRIKYIDQQNFGFIIFRDDCINLEKMAWGCYLSPGTTLTVHRELIEEIGTFDEELDRYEDWDWLLRLTRTGHNVNIIHESLATIQVNHKPMKKIIDNCLIYMDKKHTPALADILPKHQRAFQAGLLFERAAENWKSGQPFTALTQLFFAFMKYPINNYAFKRVVMPKLKRLVRISS